ncbi:MAG: M23 family metallopeptidase [Geminicoccaceae bacterium]
MSVEHASTRLDRIDHPSAFGEVAGDPVSEPSTRFAPLASFYIRSMSTALDRNSTVLREVEGEQAQTADRANRLVRQLDRVEAELDTLREREIGKDWRIDRLQQVVSSNDRDRGQELEAVTDWLGGRTAMLTGLLVDLNVDHKLPSFDVAPAMDAATGEAARTGAGGPLETLEDGFPEPAGHGENRPRASANVLLDLEKLEAAESLIARLPLAEPLDYFHITSPFGRRADPLNGKRAIHRGLDLGAARGSKVLATAAGTVVQAGRAGAYGIMVEIDHGAGIVTRYGHLSKALVEPGDSVDLRTPVGIIGSTGRSTGIHLHYEVLVDEQPRNPYTFP